MFASACGTSSSETTSEAAQSSAAAAETTAAETTAAAAVEETTTAAASSGLEESVKLLKMCIRDSSYIMKNGNDECLGKIVLGVLESRYEVVIPDIVANFKNYHPRVELEIVSAYSKDLEFDTEKKKIDMFIGPSGNYSTELTSVPLIEESFSVSYTHLDVYKRQIIIRMLRIHRYRRYTDVRI